MALENLTYVENVLGGNSIESAKDNEVFGEALDKATSAINGVQQLLEECQRLEQVIPELANYLEDADRRDLLESASTLARLSLDLVDVKGREELEKARYRIISSKSALDDIPKALARAWRSMVQGAFSSDKHLGVVLEGLPDLGELGRELTGVAKLGLLLVEEKPSAERVTLVRELEASASACRVRLGGMEGAEDVTAFLIGVAQETVTLADLTPAVLEWLGERRLLKHFSVRVG